MIGIAGKWPWWVKLPEADSKYTIIKQKWVLNRMSRGITLRSKGPFTIILDNGMILTATKGKQSYRDYKRLKLKRLKKKLDAMKENLK